jgi:PPOX class probable FMN-dependent enzyme
MLTEHIIRSDAELCALYGEGSKAAMLKQVDFIHPHYRSFIEMSSNLIISSVGPDGLDASPRGDRAGFVVVEDDRKLLMPDRRGNNRVDTLHNLIADPRIGLLFLVPGIDESLRVNGTALISTDPKLMSRFETDTKLPRSVIIVQVEAAYFQCPRAAVRADLWNPAKFVPRSAWASNGTILADISGEAAYRERDTTRDAVVRATLY